MKRIITLTILGLFIAQPVYSAINFSIYNKSMQMFVSERAKDKKEEVKKPVVEIKEKVKENKEVKEKVKENIKEQVKEVIVIKEQPKEATSTISKINNQKEIEELKLMILYLQEQINQIRLML